MSKKVDPFKNVVKADVLKEHIKKMVGGDRESESYVNGAIQYFRVHRPNKYILPMLIRAKEKANENRLAKIR